MFIVFSVSGWSAPPEALRRFSALFEEWHSLSEPAEVSVGQGEVVHRDERVSVVRAECGLLPLQGLLVERQGIGKAAGFAVGPGEIAHRDQCVGWSALSVARRRLSVSSKRGIALARSPASSYAVARLFIDVSTSGARAQVLLAAA